MNVNHKDSPLPADNKDARKKPAPRPLALRVAKWVLLSLLGVVALVVLLLCGATWWLTPARLTRIVNQEVSKVVNADVEARNVTFTLWSSWPHLVVQADSLYVRSRNLDSVPRQIAGKLPANADFLLSTGKLRGGVNLLKLFGGQFWLRDVEISRLNVNLVNAGDSLTNYGIIPHHEHRHVPRFHIDGMRIIDNGKIDYLSIPSKARAELRLEGASLEPTEAERDGHWGKKDQYRLKLLGDVDVKSGDFQLFNNYPVELDGEVGVGFKPFSIATTDYQVSLGNVRGRMSMDIELGNEVRINDFAYKLQDVTASQILASIPGLDVPALKSLEANLDVDCTARLTTPYSFSSGRLPSVEVDFTVPEGEVSYTFTDGKRYKLDSIDMAGKLVFDGDNPEKSYIDIPNLHVTGLGTTATIKARMDNVTGSPVISAGLFARSDLRALAAAVAALRPYNLTGDAELNADLRFRIENGTILGSAANVELQSDKAAATVKGTRIRTKGLKVRSGESYAETLSMDAVKNRLPLAVDLTADKITVNDKEGSVSVEMGKARIKGAVSKQGNGDVTRRISLTVSGDTATYAHGKTRVRLDKVSLKGDADYLAKVLRTDTFEVPSKWQADTYSLNLVEHTPQYVMAKAPADLVKIMKRWKPRLELKAAACELSTGRHAHAAEAGDVDISATFDSVRINRMELRSGKSHGDVAASISNLRQFLTAPGPAPLRVNLDARLDTVQFNELARRFSSANANDSTAYDTVTKADVRTYIIPRNLEASVRFHVGLSRYINLKLFDLRGDVRIADGNATVRDLKIGSDFGHAELQLQCNTADIQQMALSAQVGLLDVNIVNFLKNFHKLVVMWPSLTNLSGMLSAGVTGHLRMYPNMYVNVPSVWADANVKAWDIVLKQNRFIRHVTRMLLIPNSDPLHFANLNIHAGVHENLLEVFPFRFEVSKYKLVLEGLNNFDGQLFYHIGVEKWPLLIPFGLNVKGTYHEPKIHFGGKSWHDREGAFITGGIQDTDSVNVIKEVRKYSTKLVNAAATYEE